MGEKLILMSLSFILNPIWVIIKTWWWAVLPFLLWKPFSYLYLFWRNEKFSETEVNNILLELRMPAEVERPFKAMEQVYAGFWMIYDPPDFYEKWIEGKYQPTFSIETTSIEGSIHFYIRCPKSAQNLIESSIYAQYPEVEIVEVEDHMLDVPKNIPNKKWDLWGCDYELMKDDVYPIKTYPKFFEERPAQEEYQRIDPLAALLEGLGKLGPGERAGVQFTFKPVTVGENNYDKRAEGLVNKMVSRPDKTVKRQPIIKEAADVVLLGHLPGETEAKEEEHFIPPEMKMTPGEREIVSSIEYKVSKPMFEGFMRFVIFGERDKWNKSNLRNILGYFANFNTQNLNSFKPWAPSITKIHKHEKLFLNIFFHKTLVFFKKRHLLRRYKKRLKYNFPKSDKTFILNIEELATMFHFVGRTAVPAPSIKRVEAKKGEPPANLPQ